jgi:hypothetical protein
MKAKQDQEFTQKPLKAIPQGEFIFHFLGLAIAPW